MNEIAMEIVDDVILPPPTAFQDHNEKRCDGSVELKPSPPSLQQTGDISHEMQLKTSGASEKAVDDDGNDLIPTTKVTNTCQIRNQQGKRLTDFKLSLGNLFHFDTPTLPPPDYPVTYGSFESSDSMLNLQDCKYDPENEVVSNEDQDFDSGFITESSSTDWSCDNSITGASYLEASSPAGVTLEDECRIPEDYAVFWKRLGYTSRETRSFLDYPEYEEIYSEMKHRCDTWPRRKKEDMRIKVLESGLVRRSRTFLYNVKHSSNTAVISTEPAGVEQKKVDGFNDADHSEETSGPSSSVSVSPIKPHSCPQCDPIWNELGI